MKKAITALLAVMLVATACKDGSRNDSRPQTYTVRVEEKEPLAGSGLDLQAVGALLKGVKSPEDLERKLNEPGGVNNLDLDGDGSVDYISVSEEDGGGGDRHYVLYTEPASGQKQAIAEITVRPDSATQTASVQITGDDQLYGGGHCYHSSFPVAEFLFWHWVLTPHPYYHSPYYHGYRPGWYRPYAYAPAHVYRSRSVVTTTRTTYTRTAKPTLTASKQSSASKMVAQSGIKRSIANPTPKQQAFTAQSKTKALSSKGFDGGGSSYKKYSSAAKPSTKPAPKPSAKPSTPTNRKPASYSSSPSRKSSGSSSRSYGSSSSGRSYGGSSSSSRKSSGSSWGRSSGGSRSFRSSSRSSRRR